MQKASRYLSLLFLLLAIVPLALLQHSTASRASAVINEYSLSNFSSPWGITSGPDGNIWFTETYSNNIGRITPSGVVTEFHVASSYQLGDITAGHDGNLWFVIQGLGGINPTEIGQITTSGVITEFPIPDYAYNIASMTAGPDGNIWFTDSAGKVCKITPTGAITEYPLSANGSDPAGIVTGPDGNLWFTEAGYAANAIGRITTNGVITEFQVPTPKSGSEAITVGPDHNLWFTENTNPNKIGRITVDGNITEYPVPASTASLYGITAGSDGNLWFTDYYGNELDRITTSGVVTIDTVPTAYSEPTGITAGPDGNIWFSEYKANKIGELSLNGIQPTPSPSPTPKACPAIQFIGVMGSGERKDYKKYGFYGATVSALKDQLLKSYPNMAITAIDYPAAPVPNTLDPRSFFFYGSAYVASVKKGIKVLTDTMNRINIRCPDTKLVLVGYSQGAHIVGDVVAMDPLLAITGVVLFGDPVFNPKQPDFDKGNYDKNLAGWAVTVGGLPARTIYPAMSGRLVSYCQKGDLICNFSLSNLLSCLSNSCPHYHYAPALTGKAVKWLVGVLG